MSTRFFARLCAVERILHHRDRQARQSREWQAWQDALAGVRLRIAAALRGDPLPAGDPAEMHDAFTGYDRADEVRARLSLRLQETHDRLQRLRLSSDDIFNKDETC